MKLQEKWLEDSAVTENKIATNAVTVNKINALAVTAAKLNADVAGNGLDGTGGVALAVDADGGTLTVGAAGVKVSTGGIDTNEIAAGAITNTEVDAAAAIVDTKLAQLTTTNKVAATAVEDKFIRNDGDDTSSGKITANGFDASSAIIANVATPSIGTDAANKDYVDAVGGGISAKGSARVATTGVLADAYTYDNGTLGVGATLTKDSVGAFPAQDSITMVAGEHIIIKDEVAGNAPYNGIYTLTTLGDGSNPWVLTRRADCDEADEFVGSNLFVEEGTVNSDKKFVCTTNEAVTVGTTDITFSIYSSLESLVAGTGVNKSGSEIRIGASGATGNISGINRTTDDIAAAVNTGTLEIASNLINVKDSGIDSAQLAADSVTAVKVNADVAGDGMIPNAGTGALDVVGGNGITANANDIAVTPGDLITGGSAEIDGDKLDIDWAPSNYSPSTAPSEADSVDNLTAHLYGIDLALGSAGGGYSSDALVYTDTSNKVIGPLSAATTSVSKVNLFPIGGVIQEYAVDYTVREVTGGSGPGYYICIATGSTAPGGGSFNGGSNPSTGIDAVMTSSDKIRTDYPA